jgi:hypothetical protein
VYSEYILDLMTLSYRNPLGAPDAEVRKECC